MPEIGHDAGDDHPPSASRSEGLVLALTGVPGTGKTSAAQALPEAYHVVDAGELARRIGAIEGQDAQRDTEIVDERLLEANARAHLPAGNVVVEGVLAHFCDPDRVLVLRCHPCKLRRRLQQRGWSEAKIEENVMAETLDALLQEVDPGISVELDTTERSIQDVAACIVELFTKQPLAGDIACPLGTVDWTDTLLDEDPS